MENSTHKEELYMARKQWLDMTPQMEEDVREYFNLKIKFRSFDKGITHPTAYMWHSNFYRGAQDGCRHCMDHFKRNPLSRWFWIGWWRKLIS